jgi:hypothetical protein
MRQRITKSKKGGVKSETKIENRQIASHLQERYYYTYDIKNVSAPEGELFVIERQMRVARLNPRNTKPLLEKKSVYPRKKIYKSAASQNLKKETARNEKN